MSQRHIGFIISGAAAQLPQELALAYHLIEEKGIIPTVLAGSSAGALSCAMINGVLQNKAGEGDFTWDMLKKLLFTLSNDKVYESSALVDPETLDDLEQALEALADFFQRGPLFHRVGDLVKLIGDIPVLIDAIPDFLLAWKRGYILNTNPFRKTLDYYVKNRECLNYQTFGKFYLPTHISAVNNENGKPKRFYCKNPAHKRLNPVDILLASTAIPVIFPSQNVDGVSYVDGGTSTDQIPVEDMKHEGPFDEVYIIAPQLLNIKTGVSHVMTQVPLVSNMVFFLQVHQNALAPFQLATVLDLVRDRKYAYFYAPELPKEYSLLDFTGGVQREQFELTLEWAQSNSPRVIKEYLPEIGFPVTPG